MPRLEFGERRPFADDHLGARPIAVEESADILFHRDAANIKLDRPRESGIGRMRRAVGAEQGMIDAAFPHHRLRQALPGEFARKAARRDHDVPRRAVEPADEAPDERR